MGSQGGKADGWPHAASTIGRPLFLALLDRRRSCLLPFSLNPQPCCYSGTAKGSPFGVRRAMGVGLAADVDRSYRLAAAGYHVDWSGIPRVVTPMNRIVLGEP